MSPSPKPENAIRRLFRESERHQRASGQEKTNGPVALVDETIATTIERLEEASSEMDRLRAMAVSQQDLLWSQKQELADTRRQVSEALDQAVRSDRLYLSEKVRAELAEARAEQLAREVATLRAHVGSLTNAVSRSFEGKDKVSALRVVA